MRQKEYADAVLYLSRSDPGYGTDATPLQRVHCEIEPTFVHNKKGRINRLNRQKNAQAAPTSQCMISPSPPRLGTGLTVVARCQPYLLIKANPDTLNKSDSVGRKDAKRETGVPRMADGTDPHGWPWAAAYSRGGARRWVEGFPLSAGILAERMPGTGGALMQDEEGLP